MSGIFDSHAHYDDSAFDEGRDELLSSLPLKGVSAVINCASDITSCSTTLDLAHRFPFIYAACGVHGLEAAKAQPDYADKLRLFLSDEKCVAVGEIGLDYHYESETRDIQLKVFEQQLKLANEFSLPVIVHDREAHADTLELLQTYKPKGVVHCFSGSVEMAKEIIRLGMYIGLGGAVTFKNAKKPCEVAAFVPEDRLLIETDCPYMTPVPHRGERNDSSLIPFTARKLAEIRGVSEEKIIEQTFKNAQRLFNV